MADQSYRIAFTDAVVRTGIPPANPLYFAGTSAPMHYYYFWYVLCAAVVKLGHLSSRQAFIASSVWAGFGLVVTVSLYSQYFFRWERRKRWVAVILLLVTGADLLPALGNAFFQSSLNGDIEWWSVDPIDAWPDSLLWVPHHVASVLCCLICFLLIWRTRERIASSARRSLIVLAAMAFASSFGLSIYVALGFAVLMIAWVVRLTVLNHHERLVMCRRIAAISLISGGLLTPFVFELATSATHGAPIHAKPAPHLFSLSVRPMIDSGLLTGLSIFSAFKHTHPLLLDQVIRLALLLPGLVIELGIYGAVLVLVLRCKQRSQESDEARKTVTYLAICGLLLTMFLSSSVITNNDFGYRAVMLPQFFLLLLAADVLGDWWTPSAIPLVVVTPVRRRLLYGLLGLGAAGTFYGAILLRAWLPIVSRSPQSGFSRLPDDAFQVREAFAALNTFSPRESVVGFSSTDPSVYHTEEVIRPDEFYQRILVMDSGRQMLNAEWKCAVHFGGNLNPCTAIRNATATLYATPAPSTDWAKDFCRQFGVRYLAISYRDAGWASSAGWPSNLPVVAQQPGFKLLQCNGDGIR